MNKNISKMTMQKCHDYFNQCIRDILATKALPDYPSDFDPHVFNQYIKEHRLAFLFYNLSGNFLIHHASAVKKHLSMTKYLLELTMAFKERLISYVVLKGIPLNEQLHGARCARISKDIDILIDMSNLLAVHQVLMNLGYTLVSEFTPAMLQVTHPQVMCALKDLTYIHLEEKVEIELHWGTTIVRHVGFQLRDLDSCDHVVWVQNQAIFVCPNEYNFVYLCIHGASSHWQRLQWLLDVAFFYKKLPLSWPLVLEVARKHHGLRALLEAKYLLQEYGVDLGPVPASWRDRISVNAHLHYVRYIWRHLKPLNNTVAQLFQLFLYPRFYQKYDFIRNRILFRLPCREKLISNPRYPIFLLCFIGIFSSKRASSK